MSKSQQKTGLLHFQGSGSLADACAKLRRDVEHDRVLLREDLIRLVSHIALNGIDCVGLWRHKDRLNSSLCFCKLKGALQLFEDEGEISAKLQQLNIDPAKYELPGFTRYTSHNYFLFVRYSNAILPDRDISFFPQLLQSIGRRSIEYLKDLFAPDSKRLKQEIDFSLLVETFALIARRSINYLNIQSKTSRRIGSRLADAVGRLSADPEAAIKELFRLFEVADDVSMTCIRMRFGDCDFIFDRPNISYWKKKVILGNLDRYTDLLRHSAANTVPIIVQSKSTRIYFCCYPVKLLRKNDEAADFVIATSVERPDASFVSRFVQAIVDLEAEIKRSRKLNTLSDAYAVLREAKGEVVVSTYSELIESFRKFVEPISKSILAMTESHSVTIRLFDIGADGLRRIYGDHTGTGSYDRPNHPHDVLRIRDYPISVNSFCYLIGSAHFPYVYLGNCRDPVPVIYKDLGLDSTMRVRGDTVSEICFPVFFGDVPIGTINLESNRRYAFDEDLSYLLLMKNIIEDRYRAFFDRIDLEWLHERIQYSDALHDLSNFLNSAFFHEEQKRVLRDLFFPKNGSSNIADQRTFSGLGENILDWINSSFDGFSDETIDQVRDIVVLNGPADLNLPLNIYERTIFIVKHFVNNIVNNAYPSRDKIMVSVDRRFKSAERRSLRIRLKTHGIFEFSELDRAALTPIQKPFEDDENWHYGLYTVGLLSRSVGGVVHVGSTTADGTTIIEADIPLEGASGNDYYNQRSNS